jgi:hypothetical protein
MSPNTREILIKGHAQLAAGVAQNQLACLTNGLVPCGPCQSRDSCWKAIQKHASAMWIPSIQLELAFNTFNGSGLSDSTCPACRGVLRRRFDDGKRALWSQLPEMFGLPPWQDLVNFDFK